MWIGSVEVRIGSGKVWIGSREEQPELGLGDSSEEVQFSGMEEERLDRWRWAAAWKSARSELVDKSSDHHGLDQHKDFRRVTERQRMTLRLVKVVVTPFLGSLEEGSMGRAKRWGRVFSKSKRFQFGTGRERAVFGLAMRTSRRTGR